MTSTGGVTNKHLQSRECVTLGGSTLGGLIPMCRSGGDNSLVLPRRIKLCTRLPPAVVGGEISELILSDVTCWTCECDWSSDVPLALCPILSCCFREMCRRVTPHRALPHKAEHDCSQASINQSICLRRYGIRKLLMLPASPRKPHLLMQLVVLPRQHCQMILVMPPAL